MTTSLRTDIGRLKLVLVWMKGLLGPVEMDVEVPLLPEMVSKINLSKQLFKYYREWVTSDDFIIPAGACMAELSGPCHWLLLVVAIQLLSLFVSLSLNVVPAIVAGEFMRPHQLMNPACPSWELGASKNISWTTPRSSAVSMLVYSVFSKQSWVTGVTKCTATVITSHSSLSRVLLHSKNPTGTFPSISMPQLRAAMSKLTQTVTHHLYWEGHRRVKKVYWEWCAG